MSITSATFTSDFHQEFEAETSALLRRRFLWFTGLAGGFGVATFLLMIIVQLNEPAAGQTSLLSRPPVWIMQVLGTILYAGMFIAVWRQLFRGSILHLSFWVIFLDGLIQIIFARIPDGTGSFWALIVTHFLASLFLPWTPVQAIRPLVPLLIINAVLAFARHNPAESYVGEIIAVCLTPLIGFPGTLVCAARHSRRSQQFKLRFLESRYGQVRRELVDARRIHEAIMPRPERQHGISFDYRYEPMRQIGGDYLFTRFSPRGDDPLPAFNLLLLDVTGHGIAAALTVHRLHGEIERLFAEDPYTRPGDVLRALNRYIHLTLATHSVYVTALCVRIDPNRNSLEFASGGHPPAFLLAADGTLDRLGSTAFVLGACADADFESLPESRPFAPGDTLIAYTDGAIEARNPTGRMLGVEGLQLLIASAPPQPPTAFAGPSVHAAGTASAGTRLTQTSLSGRRVGVTPESAGWAARLLSAVDRHRSSPPADDTLIIEIARTIPSLDTGPASRSRRTAPATMESLG